MISYNTKRESQEPILSDSLLHYSNHYGIVYIGNTEIHFQTINLKSKLYLAFIGQSILHRFLNKNIA